jgi:TonB family protein
MEVRSVIFATLSCRSLVLSWILSFRSSGIVKLAFFLFLLVSALSLVASSSASAQEQAYGRLSERSIRSHQVIKGDPPIYPDDALKEKKSGVAVVEILIDDAAHITKITVWEAPAKSIAEAVRKTVSAWQFRPLTLRGESKGRSYSGKLTFYFVIESGKGKVYYPDEAPFVGHLQHAIM